MNAHRLLLLCAATTWRATLACRVKPPAGSACLPWMCCRWLAAQVPCSRRLLTSVEHEQPRVRSASPRGHDAPSMVLECARDVLSWPLIRSLLCMVVLLCAGYRSIERYTACRISRSHASTGPTCISQAGLALLADAPARGDKALPPMALPDRPVAPRLRPSSAGSCWPGGGSTRRGLLRATEGV